MGEDLSHRSRFKGVILKRERGIHQRFDFLKPFWGERSLGFSTINNGNLI